MAAILLPWSLSQLGNLADTAADPFALDTHLMGALQVSGVHVPGCAEHMDSTAIAVDLWMGLSVLGPSIQHARGEKPCTQPWCTVH